MTPDSGDLPTARLELRSLSVSNLRVLQDIAPIALDPALTVLVGQNGGGKTSFIDALSMLLETTPIAREARTVADQAVTVVGVFETTEGGESFTVRATDPGPRVQREVQTLVHPRFGDEPDAMTLPQLRKAFADTGIASPGGTAKQPFVDAANEWIDECPRDELEERWVALRAELASRLPSLTLFASRDADSQQGQVQRLVARRSQELLSAGDYEERLTTIAQGVQKDIDPLLDLLKERVMQYCPGVDGVDVSTFFDFSRVTPQVRIRLKEVNGESIELGEAGSGLAQRVGLAIYAANLETLQDAGDSTLGSVLAYDEPDTHLDYQGQRELLEIIRDQALLEHVQVVVATHSANLIDKVELRSLRHFRLDGQWATVDGPARYTEYDESAFVNDLAAGLGLRNSVLLSEKSFLVVEGDTEQRALPILFRRLVGEGLAGAGVTLLNTGGSGSVRRLVEVLIQDLERAAVVLVDEDARARPGRITQEWLADMQLIEGTSAFFVGTKEFEDAFSDEVWLRVGENWFPVADGQSAWELGDFSSARTNDGGMGDALVHLFASRSHSSVTKPQVGEALARTVVVPDELPTKVREAIRVAYKMAKEG